MVVSSMPLLRHRRAPSATRHLRGSALLAISLVSLFTASPVATAQQAQPFQLDPFAVPVGPDDGVALQRPRVIAARSVQLQLRTDYANRSLVVRLRGATTTTVPFVEHRLTGALTVAYGLVDRVSMYVTLPFVLHQEGRGVLGLPAPATRGLGDLVLGMNAQLYGGVDGAQLGVGLALVQPTGSTDAFASDARIGAVAQLRFAYAANRWSLGATAGVTLRPDREWLTHQTGADLSLVVGAFVHPAEGFRLGLELSTATGLTDGAFFEPARTPLEATLSGRLNLDYGLYVLAAAGLGLADGVGAPRARATMALGWTSSQTP